MCRGASDCLSSAVGLSYGVLTFWGPDRHRHRIRNRVRDCKDTRPPCDLVATWREGRKFNGKRRGSRKKVDRQTEKCQAYGDGGRGGRGGVSTNLRLGSTSSEKSLAAAATAATAAPAGCVW